MTEPRRQHRIVRDCAPRQRVLHRAALACAVLAAAVTMRAEAAPVHLGEDAAPTGAARGATDSAAGASAAADAHRGARAQPPPAAEALHAPATSADDAPGGPGAGLFIPATKAGPARDLDADEGDETLEAGIVGLGVIAPDPHEEAAHATAEAALGEVGLHERTRSLAQGYIARPPTWIQQAATVNLAEFPQHEDPSASSEHELQTLEWVLAERARQAAAQAAETARDQGLGSDGPSGRVIVADPEELGVLQLLLPSTWLPLLRENRDSLLAGGAGLLLLSWLVTWLAARRRRRSHHRAARRRHHRHHVQTTPPDTAADPGPPPRRSKRRRRHSVHGGHALLASSHGSRSGSGGGSGGGSRRG